MQSRNFSKIVFFSVIGLLISGYVSAKEILFSGKTMGTTYHIKVVSSVDGDTNGLDKKIDMRLEEINQSMSTYIKDSEISRFNEDESGKPFEVTSDFYKVMTVSQELYQLTDGAWDGTINPLVNLWGFGKTKRKQSVPQKDDILKLLENTGFHYIRIIKNNLLIKKNRPSVTLDFASIAKGYGVDQIANVIKNSGVDNFLVEIGGEVYAFGVKENGSNWRVGVNRPDKNASTDQIYKVINLTDRALATSGDYRIFFEIDGLRYSHVIDPRTGYPVKNGVVSVSILADSCMFADGLATAVMVMGHKKGLELVRRLKNTECLIIVREKDGRFTDYFSDVKNSW